jgi:hypothetical protein
VSVVSLRAQVQHQLARLHDPAVLVIIGKEAQRGACRRSSMSVVSPHNASASTARSAQLNGSQSSQRDGMLAP